MNDIRMEKIYDVLINGMPLTKYFLSKFGINESDIKELVDEQRIVEVSEDTYELYTLYDLYYYGVDLLAKKEIKKANACFKRCYQLNPNNRIFLLQLLIKSLKLREYEMFMKRFSKLEQIESGKHQPDNNLYLYLINIINPCSEEYQDRLANMEYDDIFLPNDSSEYHLKEMNNIRHLIMKMRYRAAIDELNRIIFKDGYSTAEQEILRELLNQVLEKEKENKLHLLDLAKIGKYQDIISILKNTSRTRYLSNHETYIVMISQAIVELLDTGLIPEPKIENTQCLYKALLGKNYALAQTINDKYMIQSHPPLDYQIMEILLRDLNNLTNKLSKDESARDTQPVSDKSYFKSIEDIAYFIQGENIVLDEAIKKFKLTSEDLLIIKLIYARSYYAEEMYLLGDIQVQEVEKHKDKTSRVLKLLNEVRTNKQFYKNRKQNYVRTRRIESEC